MRGRGSWWPPAKDHPSFSNVKCSAGTANPRRFCRESGVAGLAWRWQLDKEENIESRSLAADFVPSVAVLVSRPPPPAPDSITRIYLLRGITLIRKATENCTENRIFALSHGLSEARQMFREVDQRLSVLEAESCDLLKANRDTCSESR